MKTKTKIKKQRENKKRKVRKKETNRIGLDKNGKANYSYIS